MHLRVHSDHPFLPSDISVGKHEISRAVPFSGLASHKRQGSTFRHGRKRELFIHAGVKIQKANVPKVMPPMRYLEASLASPGPGTHAYLVSLRFPLQEIVLLNLFAAALNQNDQQNDSNYAGNNPDDRCIVHVSSPFPLI
jgi:hypothetical protein